MSADPIPWTVGDLVVGDSLNGRPIIRIARRSIGGGREMVRVFVSEYGDGSDAYVHVRDDYLVDALEAQIRAIEARRERWLDGG